MRQVKALAAATIVACAVSVSSIVSAGGGDASSINATITDQQPSGGQPSEPPPPSCYWDPYAAGPFVADAFNMLAGVTVAVITMEAGSRTEITVEYYSEDQVLHRYDRGSGTFEYRADYTCENGAIPEAGNVPGEPEWFPAVDPDPQMLLVRTMIDVETIDAPVPQLSPPANQGVPVNLGMWLAVEAAGPYEAWAGFNDRVWARRTATLVSTTFDPGNGDAPVVCEGTGTPIPPARLDTIEQGPCGYTYTQHGDVLADLIITITSRWAVRWELSNGQSGDDADLVTSTSFPYDVYEIQNVGQSG